LNAEIEVLPRILLAVFLLSCWTGAMWLICHRTTYRDIPSGMPILLMPFALLIRGLHRLWRSQRIRAFLRLLDSHDSRMRKKRVDGFLPRPPAR
jgi:hypothetical protein